MTMRPVLLLLFAVLACTSTPPREPTALAADADCDCDTPLVPGVPGSPGHLIPSDRNPNGISELAFFMRRYLDDLRVVRDQLESGDPVKELYPTHRRMRCAWHTDPADRTKDYDDRAQVYLAAVRSFDEAPSRATFNGVVAGCIACHAVTCPGPIDVLATMVW